MAFDRALNRIASLRFVIPAAVTFCALTLSLVLTLTYSSVSAETSESKKPVTLAKASPSPKKNPANDDDVVDLDLFNTEHSYVGSSGFEEKGSEGKRSYGEQDEAYQSFDYAHRFLMVGKVYFRLGLNYGRHDFGTSDAPLPTTIQNLNSVIGVEYVVQNHPAVFIRLHPGIYFSKFSDVTWGSFDVPTEIGTAFPICKSVYGFIGIRSALLSEYPVLPIGGIVWLINDKLRLEAVPPEPRLIYTFNEHLDLFVGGEVMGDDIKRNRFHAASSHDQKLSGGVINYFEYRVGAGFTFKANDDVNFNVDGGWTIQREFDYFRTDRCFDSDGAPFVKLSFSAEF